MKLSKRQHQLMTELVKGSSNKQIARVLGVREGTIKMMLHLLYLRHGARSRVELAMMFISRGQPPD